MSSNNMTIIIQFRVDEETANAIRAKADSHFNDNIDNQQSGTKLSI